MLWPRRHRPDGDGPGSLVVDAVGWDVATWSRALAFCAGRSRLLPPGDALEVGADGSNGGLSLFLADAGWDVLCSGLHPPSDRTLALHAGHGVSDRVRYARLDVLRPLPSADLVVVKSVLGHVAEGGRDDLLREAVANLWAAVRPGGELWLIENAAGSRAHDLARRRLGAGRTGWRYLTPRHLDELLPLFDEHEHAALGVTAALGRTERQRRLLGAVDRLLEPAVPDRWRYVVAVVARRGASGPATPAA